MKASTTKVYIDPQSKKRYDTNRYKNHFQKKKAAREDLTQLGQFSPTIKDKLLAFSCYFTFGLSGLFSLFVNFVNNKEINKYTKLHIFQSIFLGLTVLVSMLILEGISFVGNIIIMALKTYGTLYGAISSQYPLIIFCMMSFFGVAVLMGKTIALPGLNNVARHILK
jgi:hypothetical protein